MHKILYYDAPSFQKELVDPNGKKYPPKEDILLDKLSKKQLFAIRQGNLRLQDWSYDKDKQAYRPIF